MVRFNQPRWSAQLSVGFCGPLDRGEGHRDLAARKFTAVGDQLLSLGGSELLLEQGDAGRGKLPPFGELRPAVDGAEAVLPPRACLRPRQARSETTNGSRTAPR